MYMYDQLLFIIQGFMIVDSCNIIFNTLKLLDIEEMLALVDLP